ncbi:histone deacetylase 8 [Trametes polyzona]|nr:histone deacetylase 8 [Trametes polyzona]
MNAENGPRRVSYIVSNELVKASSRLPSNKNRSFLVHSLVQSYGLLTPSRDDAGTILQVLPPIPADIRELSAYHDREYLEYILRDDIATCNDEMGAEFGLEEDCPAFPELPQYVKLVGGATLTAAKTLRDGRTDVVICWDGGRHHAQKSRASGFCYVADCILAILVLKRTLSATLGNGPVPVKPRVMYLDLDLHFSDGVSQAFYAPFARSANPQILTFSIHHAAPGFFPISELSGLPDPTSPSFDPFTLSLPLECGASNATFARVWPIVDKVKDAFRPDYVVVQCGADGLAGDPYATWNWSLGGEDGSFGSYIDKICRWGCRVLLLGGGGYNSPNVARAWTYLTSIALNRTLSLDADIPDHAGFPLYAPSFILDVPPGNIQDRNTEQYLQHVEDVYSQVIERLSERVASSAPGR